MDILSILSQGCTSLPEKQRLVPYAISSSDRCIWKCFARVAQKLLHSTLPSLTAVHGQYTVYSLPAWARIAFMLWTLGTASTIASLSFCLLMYNILYICPSENLTLPPSQIEELRSEAPRPQWLTTKQLHILRGSTCQPFQSGEPIRFRFSASCRLRCGPFFWNVLQRIYGPIMQGQ